MANFDKDIFINNTHWVNSLGLDIVTIGPNSNLNNATNAYSNIFNNYYKFFKTEDIPSFSIPNGVSVPSWATFSNSSSGWPGATANHSDSQRWNANNAILDEKIIRNKDTDDSVPKIKDIIQMIINHRNTANSNPPSSTITNNSKWRRIFFHSNSSPNNIWVARDTNGSTSNAQKNITLVWLGSDNETDTVASSFLTVTVIHERDTGGPNSNILGFASNVATDWKVGNIFRSGVQSTSSNFFFNDPIIWASNFNINGNTRNNRTAQNFANRWDPFSKFGGAHKTQLFFIVPSNRNLGFDISTDESDGDIHGDISDCQVFTPTTQHVFLPVYLNNEKIVLDSSENSVTTLDASYNFIMNADYATANFFREFLRYKKQDNVYTFSFNEGYKILFEQALKSDIENTETTIYDSSFNSGINPQEASIGRMLVRYIADTLMGHPLAQAFIANESEIINSVNISNLHLQLTSAMVDGLSTSSFSTQEICNSLIIQFVEDSPDRFLYEIEDTVYKFPFCPGDYISLFIKMNCTINLNEITSDAATTTNVYQMLKNIFGSKTDVVFDDSSEQMKLVEKIWRIKIKLK